MSNWQKEVTDQGQLANGMDFKIESITSAKGGFLKGTIGKRLMGISKKTGNQYDFFDCSFSMKNIDTMIAGLMEMKVKMQQPQSTTREPAKQAPRQAPEAVADAITLEEDDFNF